MSLRVENMPQEKLLSQFFDEKYFNQFLEQPAIAKWTRLLSGRGLLSHRANPVCMGNESSKGFYESGITFKMATSYRLKRCIFNLNRI